MVVDETLGTVCLAASASGVRGFPAFVGTWVGADSRRGELDHLLLVQSWVSGRSRGRRWPPLIDGWLGDIPCGRPAQRGMASKRRPLPRGALAARLVAEAGKSVPDSARDLYAVPQVGPD